VLSRSDASGGPSEAVTGGIGLGAGAAIGAAPSGRERRFAFAVGR
jgi:hypothetical protein